MGTSAQKLKVVYVAGFERSGSTFLTKALGELPDTFAAGELRGIWWTSYLHNQTCGCGLPFDECPIWSEVTRRVFGSFDDVNYEWMTRHRPKRRHTTIMLMPGCKSLVQRRFSGYIQTLAKLYKSIGDVTGARVVVDSSKTPLYGYVLSMVPSIDLYVVHLVRDARGVQCSNLRRKRQGVRNLRHHNLVTNTLLWNVINLCQEYFGLRSQDRYLRLRHEDVVKSPESAIEKIKMFIGEPSLGFPPIHDGRVQLSSNHIMNGSHNRFETGSVAIRSESSWREEIDNRTRSVVTLLTCPLLLRYGYQF